MNVKTSMESRTTIEDVFVIQSHCTGHRYITKRVSLLINDYLEYLRSFYLHLLIGYTKTSEYFWDSVKESSPSTSTKEEEGSYCAQQ